VSATTTRCYGWSMAMWRLTAAAMAARSLSSELTTRSLALAVRARKAGGEGGEAYVRHLCWRGFHAQVDPEPLAARLGMPELDGD
jgi:hypothetical protein